jgi:hypothetical protein
MARATYEVLRPEDHDLVCDAVVVLRDLDGRVSVTNDAEAVVREVLGWKGGWAANGERRRILYFDTDGRLDELLHDGQRFLGFAPGPRTG